MRFNLKTSHDHRADFKSKWQRRTADLTVSSIRGTFMAAISDVRGVVFLAIFFFKSLTLKSMDISSGFSPLL